MQRQFRLKRRGLLQALGLGTLGLSAGSATLLTRANAATFPPSLATPKPNPHNYGFTDISTFLGNIYGPTTGHPTAPAKAFASYFNLQTFRWGPYLNAAGVHLRDGFTAAAGDALGASFSMNITSAHANPPVYPWKQINDPADCIINLQVMDTLAGQTAFSPTSGPHPDENVLKRVFVTLDSLNIVLPYDTAMLVSACFVKGFVTRYILGKFGPLWSSAIPAHPAIPISFDALSPPHPGGPPPTNPPNQAADTWIANSATALAATFADPSLWGQDYTTAVTSKTDVSVQMLGVLAGWRAVDNLDSAAAGGNVDATFAQQQIWKLIGISYNTERLGRMVGYVLMVLSGFLMSDRTASIISATSGNVPNPPADNAAVFADYTSHITKNRDAPASDVSELVTRIQKLVIGELYSISINASYNGPLAPADAAAQQSAFIGGFAAGMTQAADQLFAEFYSDGFYAGYKSGFEIGDQVGYSAGFSDGYSQGYAGGYQAGYANSLPPAQSFLGGLTSIISGIGGATKDITDILGATSTAGTVIASVASLF
jgi:hypothetical protein